MKNITLKINQKALIYEANEFEKLAYYKTDKLGQIEKKKIEKIFDYYKLMGFTKKDMRHFDSFCFNYENKILLQRRD